MRFSKVFSIVLVLHIVAAAMIIVQPGCHSAQEKPQPADTLPGTVTAPSTTATGLIPATTSPTVDDAFNASFAGGNRVSTGPMGRRAPTRPDAPLPVAGAGEVLSDRLQPLPRDGFEAPSGTGAAPVITSEIYIVEPGDSLWALSRRFGLSVEEIRSSNNLTGDTIRVGQELRIPGGQFAPAQTFDPPTEQRFDGVSSSGVETTIHIVQPGQTLSGLANRYRTSVRAIMAANNLSSDMIRVGQELMIPTEGTSAPSVTDPQGSTGPATRASVASVPSGFHRVEPGETPIQIARRYGLSVGQLTEMNGNFNPRTLQVGTLLRIAPGAGSTPQALPSTRMQTPRPTTQTQTQPTSQRPVPITTTSPPQNRPRSVEDLFREAPLVDVEEVDDGDGDGDGGGGNP